MSTSHVLFVSVSVCRCRCRSQLGTMYADDYKSKRRESGFDTMIGFCVLWMTWHHVNMLYVAIACHSDPPSLSLK